MKLTFLISLMQNGTTANHTIGYTLISSTDSKQRFGVAESHPYQRE